MQVMKFGGSSVANAQNINKVIAIVREALSKDKTAVVSSAISGCTDQLILIGKKALAQDNNYQEIIDQLETKHYNLINELIVNDDSSAIKNECKNLFNEIFLSP